MKLNPYILPLLAATFAFALTGLGQEEGKAEKPPQPSQPSKAGGSQDPAPAVDARKKAFPERKGTLEALGAHLAVKVEEQRKAAREAIGGLVDQLTPNYETNKRLVETRIGKILAHEGQIAEYLLERLVQGSERESTTRNLRANIVRVLTQLRDPGTIPQLSELLANKQAGVLRIHAAKALGVFESEDVGPSLQSQLDDPSESLVREVLYSLGKCRHEAAAKRVAALMKETASSGIQGACAWALSKLSSQDAATDALEIFKGSSNTQVMRYLARYFRNAQQREATPALMEKLESSKDNELTIDILETIGRLNVPSRRKVVSRVHEFLDNPRSDVRKAAARALHRLEDNRGLPVLLEGPNSTIKKNPSQPFGYIYRAREYRELEEWKFAIIDYQRALRKSKRGQLEQKVYMEYAECYAAQRQFDRTFRILKDARITPKDFRSSGFFYSSYLDPVRTEGRYRTWFQGE